MTLEQRFFTLSPDLYCIVGMDGLIRQINPAFEKILGFVEEEVLAQPYLGFVHKDSVPATIEALEMLERGNSVSYHNHYRCKDGSYKWVEWIVEPVLEEGVMFAVGRDVTAQKWILEERERFFSVGADLLSVGTFDGFFSWVSPSWEKTLGWTAEELTAYPWLHFVHPEDHEKTLSAGQELVAGVELVSFENRYRCKDGSYRWISWRSRPFPSEKLIYGAAIDITERKRALEAAEEQRRLLKAITDNASVALFIMDEHQHCVFMNPAAEELTGFSLDEVRGRALHDIIHHTRPDGSHYPLEECPIDRAFPENNREQGEEVFVHKDGHFYTVAYTASPLREAGEIRGTVIEVQDISAKKAAEEALRESEERFRTLVEQVRDHAIFRTDKKGRPTTWNEGVRQVLGFEEHEFIDQDIVPIIFTPEDLEMDTPRKEMEEAAQTGSASNDRWMRRKDLSRIWIAGMTYGVYNTAGELEGFGKVMRDMTDAKRVEEALRLSEERYRTFVDTISSVVWTTDAEGAIVVENPSWQAFTGQTWEDYKGWGWLNAIHPDDQARTMSVWTKSVQERSLYETEYRMKRHDGEYRYVVARGAAVIAADESIREWVGTCTDIEEQKRILLESQRLVSVVQNSPDFIGISDTNGIPIFVNEGGMRLVGAEDMDEIRQTPVVNYFVPSERDFVRDVVLPTVLNEGKWAGELRFQHFKTGAAIPVIYDVFRIDDPVTGRPTSFATVTRDITERARLLETERAARIEAERVGRMKDEFLATLSHELRTPLNAILGWSQILRKGKVDAARMQQGLDTIQRNVRAQSQLIEDLLDMNGIISGKIRLYVQRVDLKSVIEAAIETVRLSAEAKGVKLQTVFDPLVGVVSGDPARLQQIIWNLLSNAIKFTPKNGKVQIVLERVDSRLEVSVIDTGQGIKPEFLPHVFERFSQADGSITRKHGGLGLGLSIVRGLTELHGGTVRVKSDGEGMGATFTVSLPIAAIGLDVAKEKNTDPNTATSSDEFDYSEQLALTGIKILVVDDELDARDLIRCVLEDAEADVITADSAQSAIELVTTEAPDVIVSDIGMPDEDGYEFIRKVRSLPPEEGSRIPAVALTAYARAEDRKRALLAGYQMHITKPVEPSELLAVVSSLTSLIQKRES